jgi:hypothetical protein
MPIVTVVVVFLANIAAWVFFRALTARLLTGKWPHEDKEAKGIFGYLP